jgi:hypothetical protein
MRRLQDRDGLCIRQSGIAKRDRLAAMPDRGGRLVHDRLVYIEGAQRGALVVDRGAAVRLARLDDHGRARVAGEPVTRDVEAARRSGVQRQLVLRVGVRRHARQRPEIRARLQAQMGVATINRLSRGDPSHESPFPGMSR